MIKYIVAFDVNTNNIYVCMELVNYTGGCE